MKKIKYCMLGLVIILFACNTKKNDKSEEIDLNVVNNPLTASGNKSDTANLPKFEFEKTFHDFGKIIQGEKISYSFKFKNIGKTNLVISNVSASCGCTVAEYPKNPLKQGESSFISVTFDSDGKKGFQSKNVSVLANTIPNIVNLTIRCEVMVPN